MKREPGRGSTGVSSLFIFLLFKFSFFMSMGVVHACLSVYHLSSSVCKGQKRPNPQELELQTDVSLRQMLGIELRLLEPRLLTAEPSLQSCVAFYFAMSQRLWPLLRLKQELKEEVCSVGQWVMGCQVLTGLFSRRCIHKEGAQPLITRYRMCP